MSAVGSDLRALWVAKTGCVGGVGGWGTEGCGYAPEAVRQ